MAEARRSLRASLETRGYRVASDSHGLRGELYIVGEEDLARALFEFKPDAGVACDTMYQGSWVTGMPPRFAVRRGCPVQDRTARSGHGSRLDAPHSLLT